MRKSLLVLTLAAVVVMAGTAMATPINLSQTFGGINYTASLNVSSGTAVLTLNGGAAFYTDNIAIKNGGTVFTLATGSNASVGSNWSFGTDYPDNNNCADTNGGKGLCAISTTSVVGNNLIITWNFTGSTTTDPWSVQFYICTDSAPACNNGGAGGYVGNFSQSGTPTTQTPEPASLGLLFAGLLGLGGLIRRRK